MVETLISYLNGLISALDMFDTLHELTEKVNIDQEVTAPGIYCTGGEYKHPKYEENILFHMRTEEVEREDTISELNCGTDVQENHKMMLVLLYRKGLIKDDKYESSKVAQNILNIISNETNKTIRNALQLYSWRCNVTDWTDNSKDIWSEIYEEVDYDLPSDYQLIKINYILELKGSKECFTTYNCDGSDTPIDITVAIQDKYCDGDCPPCPDCPVIENVGLFKTGQVTSYNNAGTITPALQDDGFYEYGYGTDFFTLGGIEGPNADGLNAFANSFRFTDELGNNYPDPYVNATTGGFANNYFIDHRTRLGWYDIFYAAGGTFEAIIATIEGSTEAIPGNKSDWFLPNYLQQMSLMRLQFGLHTGWYPLATTGVGVNKITNSTTAVNGADSAYYIKFSEGRVFYEDKLTTKNYLKCRFHYDKDWNVL